ncbi:hypothetical protein B7486_18900 [cyanobacterium TDX16]|nr:hypothetical protein B7486_18900 [cyanobacterium TDX16]
MGRRDIGQSIVCPAAVTQAEVKEPVRAEFKIAAVMVELRLVDAEQDALGTGVREICIHGIDGKLREAFFVTSARRAETRLPGSAGARRAVANEKPPVVRVVGMEGHSE